MKPCVIKQPAGIGDIFFCQKIARYMAHHGYQIIWPLKPEIEDLFEFIVKHKNLVTIGQRSGIFDVLKYFDFRKIIFYPDVVDPEMPDKARTNVNDVIFEGDQYTKNTLDICLSKYDKTMLDFIIP